MHTVGPVSPQVFFVFFSGFLTCSPCFQHVGTMFEAGFDPMFETIKRLGAVPPGGDPEAFRDLEKDQRVKFCPENETFVLGHLSGLMICVLDLVCINMYKSMYSLYFEYKGKNVQENPRNMYLASFSNELDENIIWRVSERRTVSFRQLFITYLGEASRTFFAASTWGQLNYIYNINLNNSSHLVSLIIWMVSFFGEIQKPSPTSAAPRSWKWLNWAWRSTSPTSEVWWWPTLVREPSSDTMSFIPHRLPIRWKGTHIKGMFIFFLPYYIVPYFNIFLNLTLLIHVFALKKLGFGIGNGPLRVVLGDISDHSQVTATLESVTPSLRSGFDVNNSGENVHANLYMKQTENFTKMLDLPNLIIKHKKVWLSEKERVTNSTILLYMVFSVVFELHDLNHPVTGFRSSVRPWEALRSYDRILEANEVKEASSMYKTIKQSINEQKDNGRASLKSPESLSFCCKIPEKFTDFGKDTGFFSQMVKFQTTPIWVLSKRS